MPSSNESSARTEKTQCLNGHECRAGTKFCNQCGAKTEAPKPIINPQPERPAFVPQTQTAADPPMRTVEPISVPVASAPKLVAVDQNTVGVDPLSANTYGEPIQKRTVNRDVRSQAAQRVNGDVTFLGMSRFADTNQLEPAAPMAAKLVSSIFWSSILGLLLPAPINALAVIPAAFAWYYLTKTVVRVLGRFDAWNPNFSNPVIERRPE